MLRLLFLRSTSSLFFKCNLIILIAFEIKFNLHRNRTNIYENRGFFRKSYWLADVSEMTSIESAESALIDALKQENRQQGHIISEVDPNINVGRITGIQTASDKEEDAMENKRSKPLIRALRPIERQKDLLKLL